LLDRHAVFLAFRSIAFVPIEPNKAWVDHPSYRPTPIQTSTDPRSLGRAIASG
jgi:hypothetical protein